ncbi:MAG: tRNA (N6-isopentenyl adenosine(37)-C2)-methylthiotransferase MiaB [bacterium]
MSKKAYIETLGCQMNKSDSEKILGILENIGYQETKIPEEADFLIINTCNIRAASEDKAFSYLGVWGKWKKTKPDLKIAVCGCVAQQAKEKIFKRAPYVNLIFGTHNIDELPELLKSEKKVCSILKTHYKSDKQEFRIKRKSGISAWLPIIEGCDYFCTYCVVPYTRGRQLSKKPEDIIKEAQEIINQGYKEITLLGQTVDSYGKDFKDENINLSYILRELNNIENLVRIRFLTSHPADITDDLIKTVKELDKVCEYFHIPMQSGNTEILKKMKRNYTREDYIALIEKIRSHIPDVGITSDFIAGFSGETQEQFEDTLLIVDEITFDHCNTAAYSQRKQTPAATWQDQIPREIKKQRLNELNEKVKHSVKKSNEKYLGKTLEVLVENFNKDENNKIILNGRARNNKIVHFSGDESLIGSLVSVEIQEAFIWCLKGTIFQYKN